MPGTKKHPMPCQPVDERIKNFSEVALGYDEQTAIAEAKRCIQCKNPRCVQGCPVGIDIPQFIQKIAEGDFQSSIEILKDKNSLPAICGRVCPQEDQCEKLCVVGIKNEPVAIGRLERFVADWERANVKPKGKKVTEGKKVAVVGSGPAGLTCAGELAKMGYKVTIFEAFHQPGGVLMYGIPEFRLPKKIVEEEINSLLDLGVELKTNVVIGQTITIEELFAEGYEAVFIGSGAGLPYFLNIPGENLNGVYSANEFLTRVNLMRAYLHPDWHTPIKVGKKVAVVGAGNVAMDAARTAKRLGAEEVYIVYRRSEEEMPAREEEVHHAKEEGIIFKLLTNPVEILGNEEGWVTGLKCVKMELGEPDSSGRRRPIPVEGSDFQLDVDGVIIAVGQGPNPLIPRSTPNLKTSKWGNIIADELTGKTSMEGVFAGGDVVTGAATVIKAMGAGKNAAIAIDQYLKNKG
ncbi:glutamate synthase (NADPH/NADH) small chain [Anaerobranca californiensis DSM 14826]|jgi:glutamate synthase (NADPH/NADH) small chain|uniref:Glutamate synthase (NADPH/NADH) small chain n=1 Tax=Anaerobranca californiensis DSM 14826 TaxID=1120989 RepID=A0A1M6L6N9_9FIRM|nr:NADPH-dependent glutamate synthase [Anaerobranca californiensis]SHJ66875.1 glutamate synthase (NADPH/NADH) small chain [Anaerobranca californiensis DSM 14826]